MKSILSALIAASLACCAIQAHAEEPTLQKVQLDIAPQSLTAALNLWAEQTGFQLICLAPEVARELTAPKVKGAFTATGALEQLLAGTPLVYEFTSERTVTVRARFTQASSTGQLDRVEVPRLQLAALDAAEEPPARGSSAAPMARAERQNQAGRRAEEAVEKVEEIVVTGTHIRGESLPPGNLIVIEREQIDASGYSDIGQLVASLPQNFGGGASQTTGNLTRGTANNNSLGTGINLRGLGNGATLVLLNGNRLSPGGEGSFVDVSLIPLSAIERIDVLTDGASAVYGSDAIGGVVNIITRRDYEGAESRARVATATSGGRDEFTLSQLFGHSWDKGNITASFEHTQQDELRSADRRFAIVGDGSYDLLPQQRWNSLMSSVHLDLTSSVRLKTDVLATDRHYDFKYFRSVEPPRNQGSALGIGVAPGIEFDLSKTWRLEILGNYSRNREKLRVTDPQVPGSETKRTQLYDTWSGEVRSSGELFALPAGAARVALGAINRHESLDTGPSTGGYAEDRTIRSAYAEVSIPLLGDERVGGSQLLKVSLAGRVDDYSDVGRTSNPRFAVMWRVAEDVVVRAAYSESFRAPFFFQRLSNLELNSAIAYDVPDPLSPRADGLSTAIVLDGPNPDLSPETAKSWTAGIELRPTWSSASATISLNYFDITYKDRILAIMAIDPIGFLANESYYRDFLLRQPADDVLTSILTPLVPRVNDFNTFQFGITDIPAFLSQNDFGALFDGRIHNAAESDVRGIDATFSFDRPTTSGSWGLGLNTSYLFEYSSRFTSTAPSLKLLNTVFNPIDVRVRASATWTHGPWTADAFVNYMGDYGDPGGAYTEGGQVASWTTVDFQIRLNPDNSSIAWLDGLSASLSAINLFNKNPPLLRAQPGQLSFDAENANPLGRVLALTVSKKW